jgi:glycosyltransferase involved in cell wall biosynthesis
MATGLPVVSTGIGGIPEMVIDNETGLLVSAGDANGLADAIEKVFVDLSLARRLGENGYRRAVELFSIQKNVRSLLALFDLNLA